MSIPYPAGLLNSRKDETKNWGDVLSASEELGYQKYKDILLAETASLVDGWTKSASSNSVTNNWQDLVTAAEAMSVSKVPRAPQDFVAIQDELWCPDIKFDLGWDNGERSSTKTIRRYDTGTGWVTIDSNVAAAAESYPDAPATVNTTKFAIKFNSIGDWTERNVNAICPE